MSFLVLALVALTTLHFIDFSAVLKSALPLCAPFELVVPSYEYVTQSESTFVLKNQPKSPDRLSAVALKMAAGSGLGMRLIFYMMTLE